MTARAVAVALVLALAPACGARREEPQARTRVVLRHQPLGDDPAPLRALVAAFERERPDVAVELQVVPNASDLAHQLLLAALGAGAGDLDAFVVDVVWVAELARAGWLADLSASFPPERVRAEFVAGAADAVVQGGRTWAVPWYVDVGLLYWRTDLAPRAPRTFEELAAFAREARRRDPRVAGYVWQGRQYEGLSCNVFEAIWGFGGEPFDGARLRLDTPEARRALRWLRGLVEEGLSPPSVKVAAEEDARRVFLDGRAAFMRNWPYAWALLQAPGSAVRGRVAVAPLPTATGEPGPGALGGWQLAVSSRSPPARREAAVALVRHLASPESALALALAYARNPARRASYADARLVAERPSIAALLPLVERARPRPVTPYYMLVADALQGELSAAVSGIRTPEEALRRAQAQADGIMAAR